ncbi:phosphoglycolate phosphatase [Hydrogenovibrio sp. SC-1]|uniref:SixA phosphatase family protein n=1 Tax=Hydrogenovibrio sp. SC-1 TaxID=2065820 RepID=UPI000C7BCAB4|nr:histidine phosphatase family protein [Hydrogenovibrio sp. SC-1]PLA74260.1 phosphoglycolate phosphatase [Hydrogenovibrio sp. SC-1]
MNQPLRELLLLRHAKSDWKDDTLTDLDRPLADKGKKSLCKVAYWLNDQDLIPDLILVSPAKRTHQTLKRLKLPRGIPTEVHTELYMADLETFKKLLAQVPNQYERVLIIGHNPGLESLMQFLSQKQHAHSSKLFPTASLAHFVMPFHWQDLAQGCARLTQFTRPKDIHLPTNAETDCP